MDVLYVLVPLSVFAMLGVLAVLGWAIHRGQLEDLDRAGEGIFWNEGESPPTRESMR